LEKLKHSHEDIWIITNILSSSKEGAKLYPFYLFVRKSICDVTKARRNDLLDLIRLEFDQIRDIMREVFKEKFPVKIHLIKNIDNNKIASRLLSVIIVDWLTNLKPDKSPQPAPIASRPISVKHITTITSPLKSLKSTKRDLSTKSATNLKKSYSQVKLPSKDDQSAKLKETMNQLNKEKLYLLRTQEETEYKIHRIKTLNSDLVQEYNQLFEKGRAVYNMFFEIFYALKIQSSTKFAKFPIKEEDLNQVKRFLNYSKLEIKESDKLNENPMVNVLRSKSLKNIRASSENTSKVRTGYSRLG
jgi:hypothetical protein